jgi:hypothetical protein
MRLYGYFLLVVITYSDKKANSYKVNDLYFTDKNKKRLADLITFAESVYHQARSG